MLVEEGCIQALKQQGSKTSNFTSQGSEEEEEKEEAPRIKPAEIKAEAKCYRIITNSIEPSVLSNLSLNATAGDIWVQLRMIYGTLSERDSNEYISRIHSVTTDSERSLSQYLTKKAVLISEYEDRGGRITDSGRAGFLVSGLVGKWFPLSISMETMGYIEVLTRLKRLAESEPPETSHVFAVRSTGRGNIGRRRCYWCKGEDHESKECKFRVCDTCRQKGHYHYECERNMNKGNSKYSCWVVDSGASVHVKSKASRNSKSVTNNRNVHTLNGSKLKVTHEENVALPNGLKLEDVNVIPESTVNLISIAKLDDAGYKVSFENGKCLISKGALKIVGNKDRNTNLYKIVARIEQTASPIDHRNALMIRTDNCNKQKKTLHEWHTVLNHIGTERLKTLVNNDLVSGIELLDKEEEINCEGCKVTKARRQDQDKESSREPSIVGDIVSADVVDMKSIIGISGEKFISVITDHYSGYTYCKPMSTKDGDSVQRHIMEALAHLERQSESHVKILRTDNGLEYCGSILVNFLKRSGIIHERTSKYTPQGNGRSERFNRSLMEAVRAKMLSSNVHESYWPLAVNYTVYIHNRTTISKFTEKTPFESVFGYSPDLSSVRDFGEKCWIYNDLAKDKLEARSNEGIFIGLEEGLDGFLVLVDGNIVRSRNVDFISRDAKVAGQTSEREQAEHVLMSKIVLKDKVNLDELDPVKCLYGDRSLEWEASMMKEYKNMLEHDVWEPANEIPQSSHVITSRLILRIKTDEDGKEKSLKSRLVAGGHRQRPGEYDETYSPVVKEETILAMLALANNNGHEVHQMDIDGAYLNAKLQETVYMKLPEIFEKWYGHQIVKLKKALYGLKQSGRSWNLELTASLKKLGWSQSQYDQCLFYRNDVNREYLLVYVDDLLIITPDLTSCERVKGEIKETYAAKDLGECKHILGIRVSRSKKDKTIALDQEAMISDLLERCVNMDVKSKFTPLSGYEKLTKSQGQADSEEIRKYQSIVGSILYIARWTRPDVMAAVCLLARYSSNPAEEHIKALTHILGYLDRTKEWKMIMNGEENVLDLNLYTDSDWAGDLDNRHSTSGFAIYLGNTLIHWKTSKQTCIAESTMQAEFVAAHTGFQTARSIFQLLKEIGNHELKFILHCDNMAAIQCIKNVETGKYNKHIDVKYHSLINADMNGIINVRHVQSNENKADILTKPLLRVKHNHGCEMLGLHE